MSYVFDGVAKTSRTNETMQTVIEFYLETKGARVYTEQKTKM